MRERNSRSDPIKVCFPFIGNNVGGSHISTLLLAKYLDRSQVESLVVLHEDGPLAQYVRSQGLTYQLVPIRSYFAPPYRSLRNAVALFVQTLRLARFIRRHKIDVVHTNDVRIHYGWTLAARLAKARLIWHQRTGTFGISHMKLFLALLASEVICISNYTAATLPQKLLPSIRIITNPFETRFATTDRDEAKANIIRHLGLAWDTRLVGFFGNLVEQKRPAVFLRAAAKIVEQYNGQIAFVLCGAERNNARAELTQLADELGIGHQIHLVGFQAPVEPWIAGCDMIIAPGVGEGLGRSLIEAMIVGTPVVAANSGGHSEVISNENTGLLATVDDPNAFAVAACRLLKQDDLARAIAERAQAEAVANHSIEQHVRAVTGIYLERRETPSRNTGERK